MTENRNRMRWLPQVAIRKIQRKLLSAVVVLEALFQSVGLSQVSARPIDISAVFQDFDDYWTPFLGKIGSAPTYLASVDEDTRVRIRQVLQTRIVPEQDGTIALGIRAWAVQGIA